MQKIVWASGCGSVQLVFSSNEEISKIYEKVRISFLTIPSFRKRVEPASSGLGALVRLQMIIMLGFFCLFLFGFFLQFLFHFADR